MNKKILDFNSSKLFLFLCLIIMLVALGVIVESGSANTDDTLPPLVYAVSAPRRTTPLPFTLTARISDFSLGDSPIVHAEYTILYTRDFHLSGPFPMQASDGSFGDVVENVEADVELSHGEAYSWVILCVEGFDSAGNSSIGCYATYLDGSQIPHYHPEQHPVIESLSVVPSDGVIPVGVPVEFTAAFTDENINDTHSATWYWGDGTTTFQADVQSPVQATHTYSQAGIFPVTLTIRDDSYNLHLSDSMTYESVLVYDSTGSLDCNAGQVRFETGIPADWTVVDNTGGTGIVWTTTADPACEIPNRTNGSGEAACADSDAAGSGAPPYDTELVSNPFDLSTWGAAVLDVKAYYQDITMNANDRFEVDVWDGSSWTNELTWDEDHEPEDFWINLSAYAGLPAVQVRFRYFGNGLDWFAQVDDVELTCAPPGPPVITLWGGPVDCMVPGEPYCEVPPYNPWNGELSEWIPSNSVTYQVLQITNSGGSALNWNIAEDDNACDSPTDIPWLSVSPNAGATIPLDATLVDVTFDSIGLAPGDYSANLCVSSNDPATPLIQVPVTLYVGQPSMLACDGYPISFEDGIPDGWQVVDNTGGTGIVWTTTADPACEIPNRTNGSGEAACADSDAAGTPSIPYDTELWTPLINLTGQDYAFLNVKGYYRDLNTAANDRFEVDVWNGASWINELNWDEDHEPGNFSINLTSYIGASEVRVRFRYFGNGFDYYAQVDDIALTCPAVPPPMIEIHPSSLAAIQDPDMQSTQQLNIANSGGSTLDWNIVEDDTDCDSPTDIPWMSVSPDTGSITPLGGAAVDVTLDSTGLVPGEYSANLCVNSNTPTAPVVVVPVNLSVIQPNRAPEAYDDSYSTNEDTVLNILAPGVLTNDVDADGDPLTAVLDTSPSSGTLTLNGDGSFSYSPNVNFCGSDSFTYHANDGAADSNIASVDIDVGCVDDSPHVSVDVSSQSVQYSDFIAPVTISATDVDSTGLSISDDAFSALNVGSQSCSPSGDGVACTWQLTGQVRVATGTYTVTFIVSDSSSSGSASTQVIVNAEDATLGFAESNPIAVEVVEPGGDSPAFTLFLKAKETLPDIPVGKSAPGDISLAEVSVTLEPVGPGTSVVGTCFPVGTSGSGYDAVLITQCDFENVLVNTYTVDASIVGGFYTGDNEDVLVVFDPSLGFTTGGGWFYWPGTEEKSNFGYTLKYNKKGGNVKGNFLLIRHMPDGSIYRVKSNALYGLSLGEGKDLGWASFSGKSTYLEPGWPEPIGNHEFVVYVEDHGQSGDRVWIEMHDKDGNVIAALSIPREAIDNAVELEGGNIVVPH